jgi:hypothetical protein
VAQYILVKINAFTEDQKCLHVIFRKLPKVNNLPLGENFLQSGHPGVDVMVTIFGDFRQFSAKKNCRFSQKPVV